jgi:hypothetical protein
VWTTERDAVKRNWSNPRQGAWISRASSTLCFSFLTARIINLFQTGNTGNLRVPSLCLFSFLRVMRTMNTGRPLLQDRAAGLEELPWAGATNLQQAAACTAQMTWRPYSELENSTAIWSRNTTEYNAYGGIDLQPNHQRPLPLAFAASAESGRLTPFTSEPALQVGECTADSPDGGVWHTQRVGPMVSTGGYDWHALSWRDPAFMSQAARTASTKQQTGTSGRKSEEMWGGAVGLLGHFTGPSHGSHSACGLHYIRALTVVSTLYATGPVDATGTQAICFPPIHQHRIHAVARTRDDRHDAEVL